MDGSFHNRGNTSSCCRLPTNPSFCRQCSVAEHAQPWLSCDDVKSFPKNHSELEQVRDEPLSHVSQMLRVSVNAAFSVYGNPGSALFIKPFPSQSLPELRL